MEAVTKVDRIQWIDLAKGICIMLVVLHHVAGVLHMDYPFSVQVNGFRMPLYFILSGLFFKQYEGFLGFLKRKTNKLLIPFLFFFFITAVVPYWCRIIPEETHLMPYVFKLLIFKEVVDFNDPIWFLLCLFEVNLLFYVIQMLAEKISPEYKTVIVLAMSLILGITGLILGVNELNLGLYFDSALSALPLFAFGWWLFRHTNFLRSPVNAIRDILTAIICLLVLWFFAAPTRWLGNEFSLQSAITVYPCGIAGTIMVLVFSKMMKRLPLVSVWGRYSIIILCIHYPILTILELLLRGHISGIYLFLIVFIVTMWACHLLIPVIRKYLPYVSAQKDLIRI